MLLKNAGYRSGIEIAKHIEFTILGEIPTHTKFENLESSLKWLKIPL